VEYAQSVSGVSTETVELAVYETTDSDSAISVSSHVFLVDAASEEVTQVLLVENSGNRTYRASAGHGLRVPLPEGVTHIVSGPRGVHAHGDTLVDQRPVRPGRTELAFSVRLPPGRRVVQQVVYATPRLDVLVAPADAALSGEGLSVGQQVEIRNRQFSRYSGGPVGPGESVRFLVAGLPLKGSSVAEQAVWIVVALLLATGILTTSFLGVRGRVAKGAHAASTDPEGSSQELLARLADLDDRFGAGGIAESEYRTTRASLKARTVESLRREHAGRIA